MRKGSERVANKNTKDFAGISGGLTYIKLGQLLEVEEISSIIVSTDDERVKEIASAFQSNRIKIIDRPAALASSSTSTDDLIRYVPSVIEEGNVLWTHVTSPFIDSRIYRKAILTFLSNLNICDSLMSVTQIQKFIWDENGPITYDSSVEKWPRTQTLKPIFEVNSGIFLANIKAYTLTNNRIGSAPTLFATDGLAALDIDWNEDFELAEALWIKRHGT